MKKLCFCLLVVFVAIIALAFMLQVDDELSAESKGLLQRIDTSGDSRAYRYLLGIFAAEEGDPAEVGRRLLEGYQKRVLGDSDSISDYDDSHKIPLPSGPLFCGLQEDGCLDVLFSDVDAIAPVVRAHQLLVDRYNHFLDLQDYRTLVTPSIDEVFPPFQYLVAAQRIKTLSVIARYQQGQIDEALAELKHQRRQIRQVFEQQDNLIGKMVLLAMLADNLDVTSVILSEHDLTSEPIAMLSGREKSLSLVAAREFGMAYYSFIELDKHPEFFDVGGNVPGWLTRLFFKPHMTINALAPINSRMDWLSQRSATEFAEAVTGYEYRQPTTSKWRNYVGQVLLQMPPESDGYVARLFDLDAKIALFNQLHSQPLERERFQNPFYGIEAPQEVDGRLCFSGPFDDNQWRRCLWLHP